MHTVTYTLYLLNVITIFVHGQGQVGRIVKGNDVKSNKYPYVVAVISRAIGKKSADLCGGSIVRRRWILTAAHCLHEKSTQVKVIAGDFNWKKKTNKERQVVEADKLFQHKEWNVTGMLENDIALILLANYLSFNEFVSPISIPPDTQPESPSVGASCLISGWGLTETGHISDTLKQGEVFVLNDTACEHAFGFKVQPSQMCVGNQELGVGYCVGDSGSPYACISMKENKRYLYGLDSVGALDEDFCQTAPSVATRVSYHLDFIKTTIEANSEDFKLLRLLLQPKILLTGALGLFLLLLFISVFFFKRARKRKQNNEKYFTHIFENIDSM